jgi:large subunit ribosomal protein L32
MGATPKQRISRKRRGDRRSHQHIKALQLVECPQCHNPRLPHYVCPSCGTYRGREVVQVKAATEQR